MIVGRCRGMSPWQGFCNERTVIQWDCHHHTQTILGRVVPTTVLARTRTPAIGRQGRSGTRARRRVRQGTVRARPRQTRTPRRRHPLVALRVRGGMLRAVAAALHCRRCRRAQMRTTTFHSPGSPATSPLMTSSLFTLHLPTRSTFTTSTRTRIRTATRTTGTRRAPRRHRARDHRRAGPMRRSPVASRS